MKIVQKLASCPLKYPGKSTLIEYMSEYVICTEATSMILRDDLHDGLRVFSNTHGLDNPVAENMGRTLKTCGVDVRRTGPMGFQRYCYVGLSWTFDAGFETLAPARRGRKRKGEERTVCQKEQVTKKKKRSLDQELVQVTNKKQKKSLDQELPAVAAVAEYTVEKKPSQTTTVTRNSPREAVQQLRIKDNTDDPTWYCSLEALLEEMKVEEQTTRHEQDKVMEQKKRRCKVPTAAVDDCLDSLVQVLDSLMNEEFKALGLTVAEYMVPEVSTLPPPPPAPAPAPAAQHHQEYSGCLEPIDQRNLITEYNMYYVNDDPTVDYHTVSCTSNTCYNTSDIPDFWNISKLLHGVDDAEEVAYFY